LNRILVILLVLGLGAAGFWLQRKLFPPPEERIRQTLRAAAAAASFGPDVGNLARLAAINRLVGNFTTDAEILVELPGAPPRRLTGRDELRQVAAGTHTAVRSLQIRLRDLLVEMEGGRESAQVHVIAEVRVDGTEDSWIGEFKLRMVNLDGDWLIQRIDPVRTFRM
jgi:hypothetical protein